MDFNIEAGRSLATQTVKKAGQLVMSRFHQVATMSYKGKSDIVTEIDLQAEKLMIAAIREAFPEHSILSEESGFADHHSKYIWIMDPIDGTINYYHGSTPFRIGLCLLEDKKPILSAIFNPTKKQLFLTEKDKGATVDGQRIVVNDNFELKSSVIMTHLSSKKEARARTILALESIFTKSMHMRMFGSGLAAMTYVADGQFDVFFNVQTNPWDILPGALLIQEAGGLVTDIQGNKISYESTSVLATNGKVHDQMLKLLENV